MISGEKESERREERITDPSMMLSSPIEQRERDAEAETEKAENE